MTIQDLRLPNDQHGAIIGQTGTGKSKLGESLIPSDKKVLIIDPKHHFDTRNMFVTSDPGKAAKLKEPVTVFQPTVKTFTDHAGYDKVLKAAFLRGKIFVYIDDPVGIIFRNRYPQYLQACYQLGRSKEVQVLASFQRPAWLPLFMVSECSRIFAFRVTLGNDIGRISEVMPGYDPRRLPSKHSFYFYDVYGDTEPVVMKLNLGESKTCQ